MQVAELQDLLDKMTLPSFFLERHIEPGFGSDGEDLFRVYLRLPDEFDVEQHHREIRQTKDAIIKAFRDAGVAEWVYVRLTDNNAI